MVGTLLSSIFYTNKKELKELVIKAPTIFFPLYKRKKENAAPADVTHSIQILQQREASFLSLLGELENCKPNKNPEMNWVQERNTRSKTQTQKP